MKEAEEALGKLKLGDLKLRFEQVSNAYDCFHHRKFRMNPGKPKSSWIVAGMTNPGKRWC